MKKYNLLNNIFTTGLILITVFSSCHSKENQQSEKLVDTPVEIKENITYGKIVNRISKKGSSYSYYIPDSIEEKEKFPVIIFFDPHGKGNYLLDKYKSIAENFGFILIGSFDSKNGMDFEQSKNIAADLFNEAISILPGNEKRISIAGFSGGAKAALYCGNSLPGFSSAIYCGAAFPEGSINVNIPMIGFVGSYDMNYTEVRNYYSSLDQLKISHTFVEWNGKHEWPDSASFIHAFYWCIFNSMKNKKADKNEKLINDFKKMIERSIASENNLLVKSLLLREEISMLYQIESVNNYKIKLSALENSSSFIDASRRQSQVVTYEDDRKKEIISSFENRDLNWWTSQIASLSTDRNNQSNQRILGYISLAAWSYSSKAVTANNFPFAQKSLQIYKLADPENSEQPFLEACLYSKNGMQDSAVYFINEAIKLGLADRSKIENEKDLIALKGRSDYQAVVGKLK